MVVVVWLCAGGGGEAGGWMVGLGKGRQDSDGAAGSTDQHTTVVSFARSTLSIGRLPLFSLPMI